MNVMEITPYIPGSQPPYELPLGRFLPPLKPGVVSHWLGSTSPKGSWVIDPLGSNPALSLEAARAGYRVLVTCNNPILALILEVLAEAPKKEMLQSIVADLSGMKKGEERLENYIQGLYSSDCPGCGKVVPAQAFLWKKGEKGPFKRRILCGKCGGDGDYDILPSDLQKIETIEKSSLHHAWAVSRLGDLDKEEDHAARDALEMYLSRSLYSIFTIITKSEALDLTPENRKWLYALLLSVCDEGSSLWQVSGSRGRPLKLSIPGIFIEYNLWEKLEKAVDIWSSLPESVPITHYPELPPESGGICISHGRLRSLLPLPEQMRTDQVIAVFPRANQAFWTFSALWASWIWGRKTLQSMKSGFERQHYDWHWHTYAIRNTLSPLLRLNKDFHIFSLAPELTQSFLLSVMVGGQAAGYLCKSINFRADEADMQMQLVPGEQADEVKLGDLKPILRNVVKEHLLRKGEPANYIELYSVTLTSLVHRGKLFKDPLDVSTELQKLIEGSLVEILDDHDFAKSYGSGSYESQRSWWLVNDINHDISLSDRIEMKFLEFLQLKENWRIEDLETELCASFPGFLTPSHDLFQALLDSYTVPDLSQIDAIRIRPEDDEKSRMVDIKEAKKRVRKLGALVGLICEGENPIFWVKKDGKKEYAFFLTTQSIIAPFIKEIEQSLIMNCIVVLPGGRAGLLEQKLHYDLHLAEVAAQLHFLKFRHLKELSALTKLTQAKWDDQLEKDSLQWASPRQISMLDSLPEAESDA
jgi:hypothetical protein